MTCHMVHYEGLCLSDYHEPIVVFYILKNDCCFHNSSTLIKVTTERLFGDLVKPLLVLAVLGTKKQEKLIYKYLHE